MAEPHPVCCERCKRKYVTPFDLPPVVIHAIEEPTQAPTMSIIQEFDNHNPETCRRMRSFISAEDHQRVADLIRTTVSGTGLVKVRLESGRPGLVVVDDKRPVSMEYTIRIGLELQGDNAAEIARQKERCPFVAGEAPVDLGARIDSLGMDCVNSGRADKCAWMINNRGDYMTIGSLQLTGPTGSGSFDVAFERISTSGKWQHVVLLWRVHFVIPPMAPQ